MSPKHLIGGLRLKKKREVINPLAQTIDLLADSCMFTGHITNGQTKVKGFIFIKLLLMKL